MKHIKLSELNQRIRGHRMSRPILLHITPPPYDFESSPGVKADRPMLRWSEGLSTEYFDSVEIDSSCIVSVASAGAAAASWSIPAMAQGEGISPFRQSDRISIPDEDLFHQINNEGNLELRIYPSAKLLNCSLEIIFK